jgi:hypothetical protein
VAYLLVFNSVVFRIPFRLEPPYSPDHAACGAGIERPRSRLRSCVVSAQ